MTPTHDVLAVSPELLQQPITKKPSTLAAKVCLPIVAGLAGVMWLADIAILCVIVPKFEEIYTDFGVALPGLTVHYIDVGRWLDPKQGLVHLAITLFVLAIIVSATAAMGFAKHAGLRTLGIIIAVLLLLLGVLTFAAMIPSLFVPLNDMINQLNNAAPATP